jgi:uncharacterized membrane protein
MLARTGLILMSLAFAYVPTAAQAGHGPGPYRYTSIPTLPGGTQVFPLAINRSGQVVGWGDSGDGGDAGGFTAFLFDQQSGTITSLGPGIADAVNDRGQAVGVLRTHQNGRFVWQSVLYHDGMVVPLGSLPGELRAGATSINNHGVAVGWSMIRSTSGISFALALYDGGSVVAVDLGPDLAFSPSPTPAINDDGFISGTGSTALGDSRAFRYDTRTGQTTIFEPLPGDQHTWGLGINRRGEVLGYSFVWGGTEHIGTWDHRGTFRAHFTEGTTQYPTLSSSLVFNDRDQIVITATTDGTSYIVPSVGKRYDLAPLVINLPSADNDQVPLVAGINDRGLIIGSDSVGGFVLIPQGDE